MNPLQDLKDIHTPAVIENWPPAYGWWLLMALVVIAICFLTTFIIRARKVRLAKRQALQALQQIDASELDAVSQLNQLLKRVAMAYFPTQNIQKLHGEKWTAFLVATLPNKKQQDYAESFGLMQHSLYQPRSAENLEFPSYYQSVETWVKHALPPSNKTLSQLEQNHA